MEGQIDWISCRKVSEPCSSENFTMNSKSIEENEYKSKSSVDLEIELESCNSSGAYCDLEFLIEMASRYKK